MTSHIPSPILQRLTNIRQILRREKCFALIVADADPHGSEYVAEHWRIRSYLSGFEGSAGTLVVTLHSAALWTDSRYWLQAEIDLRPADIELMREGDDDTPTIVDWIGERMQTESHDDDCQHVAFLAETTSFSAYHEAQREFSSIGSVRLLSHSFFQELWPSRPELSNSSVSIQPIAYAGQTAKEKMASIFAELRNIKPRLHGYLFCELSEIAWLLNLRGNDIDYNPVFMSYLYINNDGDVWLCINPEKVEEHELTYLSSQGVSIRPYSDVAVLIREEAIREHVIGFPPEIPATLVNQLAPENVCIIKSPVSEQKAIKNNSEQEGFRHAMERDGVAMVRFLRELDETIGLESWTELSVDKRLTELRAEEEKFMSLSFGTIAAYGAHGAIVHYEATPHTSSTLQPKGLLLLDSGAQYLDGTTDLTRTIALGPISKEERHVYTLVLKGHIGLSSLRFPRGTSGLTLDLAARRDMWAEGYDFGHGTGHGVGSHLCVHEGPQQIRKDVRSCTIVGFQPGMVVTDEPGIYVTERFGVRIENTLLVVPDGKSEYGVWCKFEPLTLCPIDLRPIDASMLTTQEIEWIDNYHKEVYRRLAPMLSHEDRIWLKKRTRTVVEQCYAPE